MAFSHGGVTLEYIDNYMTPFERDEQWATYMKMEQEKIKEEINRVKSGVPMTEVLGPPK